MQEIDFLPAEYHQTRQRRQSVPWRIVVVGAFASMIGIAAIGQHHQRQRLQSNLNNLAPQQTATMEKINQMSQLKAQLQAANTDAGLYTYLRHPWPRTQILKAVLPRPAEKITFDEIVIQQDNRSTQPRSKSKIRGVRKTEEKELAKLHPADRDLKKLQEECGDRLPIVILSGIASDSGVLYQYLDHLAKHALFHKVELSEIKTDLVEGRECTRFSATLTVDPGYGQPQAVEQGKI